MNKMRIQLQAAGHDVEFVAINAASALSDQQPLLDRASFPMVQDLPEINVWGLHTGVKDDIYIYGPDGKLAEFLPTTGETSTNLSTTEGYDNLRAAIERVVAKGK